jgi:hypothetical protein
LVGIEGVAQDFVFTGGFDSSVELAVGLLEAAEGFFPALVEAGPVRGRLGRPAAAFIGPDFTSFLVIHQRRSNRRLSCSSFFTLRSSS